MPRDVSVTFPRFLEALRPAFTNPTFARFVVVSAGWILTTGSHAVTQALVASGVASRSHHASFHRLFARASWSPDDVGRLLFERLVERCVGADPITLVIDDTLATKKGPRVFGIGTHVDAVRSSRRMRIFTFGHVWVVVSVVVRLPFAARPWALPVLFRLYRTVSECEANDGRYAKKTDLAREMIDLVASWTNARRVHVLADGAYCNDTVLRGLDERFVFFGVMRPDAVLTALPTDEERRRTGRRRRRGAPLPSPERLAGDESVPWSKRRIVLYANRRTVAFKSIDAQWYRACGTRLVRAVVVRESVGAIRLRVYFCTDPTVAPTDILATYAMRWGIEVCFRDLKQHFGFADSSARTELAVERTAPFVGLLYTAVVLYAASLRENQLWNHVPLRPWYRTKRNLSFEDLLRAVRAELLVLDPARDFENLHNRREALRNLA